MASQQETGTRDVTYNIVSVLYYALQAADTCRQYRQDAQGEGDQRVIELFDEVISRNRELADRAKECLADRLSQSERRATQGGEATTRAAH